MAGLSSHCEVSLDLADSDADADALVHIHVNDDDDGDLGDDHDDDSGSDVIAMVDHEVTDQVYRSIMQRVSYFRDGHFIQVRRAKTSKTA